MQSTYPNQVGSSSPIDAGLHLRPSFPPVGTNGIIYASKTINNNIMENMSNTDQVIDPSLEPQTRNRCNTWPLRPIIDPPSLHDSESNPAEGVIKEEPEDFQQNDLEEETQHNLSGGPEHLSFSGQLGINNSSELGSQGDLNNAKKQSARKNAWGNFSYADLITKAIQSSPEKRLTLSQIYDWMVQNVAYFRDKGDSNSSAGWKNSIRHNLSLHNRFMRIQNEGAGKSSWWVINPDAKPGKAPRRRGNSMDSSKTMSMKAKRDSAMRKVRELKNKGLLNKDGTISPVSPANEFTLSPGDGAFRDRGNSFASTCSIGGKRSPIHDPELLDPKLSPWGSDNRLDFDYQMDTTGTKLADGLELMGLKFPELQQGSLLNELESMNDPYGDPSSANLPPNNVFAGKPYTSYLQAETSSSYGSHPPPPYSTVATDQQQGQPQYNKQSNSASPLYKDPMMTGYNVATSSGNNNSLSSNVGQIPQYTGAYTNGVLPNQTMTSAAQQHRGIRPAHMTPAQPPRALPSSIRAALGNNSSGNNRSNQISQSLKESAPILTSQLLDYSSQPTQTLYNLNQSQGVPQTNRQPGMMYSSYPAGQQPGFMYNTGTGLQNSAPMNYIPSDLDLETMPELLSCDVDEIIQQELKMDGGQLDFTGFEGYTTQQQQQASANQSGPTNMRIGLS